jgi:hypothetical protein
LVFGFEKANRVDGKQNEAVSEVKLWHSLFFIYGSRRNFRE